ncbi:Carbonyl reductase (NADPH) [Bertholletia excelsa]
MASSCLFSRRRRWWSASTVDTPCPVGPRQSTNSPPTRWWSGETVVAVTGANKGIGYALIKRFAELGLTVILTARDYERGKKAVESLWAMGFNNVHFSLLDVSDQASIKGFTSWFTQRFEALYVLVSANPSH